MALSPSPSKPPFGQKPVRVMLVDDSAVVRGLLQRWLDADGWFEVAGVCPNGAAAVRRVVDINPDVIVLDVEMPEMDGITALPKLVAAVPHARIIMASTLTRRNADVTLKALELGAHDYIAKPEASSSLASDEYRNSLLEKIRVLGRASRADRPAGSQTRAAAPTHTTTAKAERVFTTRPWTPFKPQVLAIGSSTGGPQALRQLIAEFKGPLSVPVLIVQHMPKMFTTILAEHLDKLGAGKCVEAENGMPLLSGRIYLAPGDYHMTVKKSGTAAVLQLDQNAAENFCRPAVDPLFRSVADVFGDKALGLILTGMGHDGLAGAKDLIAKGGQLMAQDEASSVVWGMPGAVAEAGVCGAVKPLNDLSKTIKTILRGEKP